MNDFFLISKLIVAFTATFFFIKLIIRYAPSAGLIDIPNHRSAHKKATPRGAGIGIVFGVIVSDLLFLNEVVFSHIATFIAIFLVFIVGVLDDHRDAAPRTKFYIILAAVLLISYDGMFVNSLGDLFGYEITLGWFAIPFTIISVVGFTNALNLSDGLDGLAGLLSIIILSFLGLIGYQHHDAFIMTTAVSFIVSIAAFLWFNWNPAKIFMGDSGSLTIGFVISVLSIKALNYIQPAAILFIAALPILDTFIVMIRRKRKGESVFAADKLHIHHILLNFFNQNVKKTVIFISLIQCGFSLIGLNYSDEADQGYILILFGVNLVVLYMLLNGMLARQNKFSAYKKKKQ